MYDYYVCCVNIENEVMNNNYINLTPSTKYVWHIHQNVEPSASWYIWSRDGVVENDHDYIQKNAQSASYDAQNKYKL